MRVHVWNLLQVDKKRDRRESMNYSFSVLCSVASNGTYMVYSLFPVSQFVLFLVHRFLLDVTVSSCEGFRSV